MGSRSTPSSNPPPPPHPFKALIQRWEKENCLEVFKTAEVQAKTSDYKTGEWITVLETLCRLNWEQLVAILSQSNVKEFHWLG